jgi:hypothetical protein
MYKWRYSSFILNLRAPGRFAPVKELPVPFVSENGWVPRADLDAIVQKIKISYLCRESNSDSSTVQPVAIQ